MSVSFPSAYTIYDPVRPIAGLIADSQGNRMKPPHSVLPPKREGIPTRASVKSPYLSLARGTSAFIDPDDWEQRREWVRRQKALIHKNQMYFLGVNAPTSVLLASFSYVPTRRHNQETQAVQTFSELCRLRKALALQLDQVAQAGFVQSKFGSPWGFMQLRQLKMKMMAGAGSVELRNALKQLGPEMHQNGLLKRILADTERYAQTYERLTANPAQVRALAKIPVFPCLLQLSAVQAAHLVRANPAAFLKQLFQLGLADTDRFGPQFFAKISSDLMKAAQRRSLLIAGVVGVGLLGSFWEILHAKNRKLLTS